MPRTCSVATGASHSQASHSPKVATSTVTTASYNHFERVVRFYGPLGFITAAYSS